jgi:glutamate formiminotransferase/formiminotetrahydrofolate cyclodeaminase
MKLVECVPNFSEGRRPAVITAIRDAIAAVSGVTILDVSSDTSHNRTVVTLVVPVETAVDAAFAGIREARDRIDLTAHTGEHPRMGAADVVPFIPLSGASMEDCIALARALGERVGRELGIPVFLYERAATRPDRNNLADVRRGQFEGLRDEIGVNPARDPDFGPKKIHPTFGAVAIGARPMLVAYNVYLGAEENLETAKRVAAAVRGSSGGLQYVKAMGIVVDGQAQVSMNLVDTERTPLHRAYDMVKMEAAARGVDTTWSEIVGLVPERSLFDAAARHLQLDRFGMEQVLEHRVRGAVAGGPALAGFIADVASSSPTPGGGSVAAHAGAAAAALVQMVAGLTIGKKKYAAVGERMRAIAVRAAELVTTLSALVDRDARAYGDVSAAYKMPREPEDAARRRAQAVTAALLAAAAVPLETARACAEVAHLAEEVARTGNANALSDAGVAALMAQAACRGAAYNVRINVAALDAPADGADLVRNATRIVEEAARDAGSACAAVERAL